MALIVPAILAATAQERTARLQLLPESVEMLSFDLIDGTYCEGNTFLDPDDTFTQYATGLIELDIMSANPLGLIRTWAGRPQVVRAIVPAELDADVRGILDEIHQAGMDAGISLLPTTSVIQYEHLYNECEVVMIRGNAPGKSGQPMLENTPQRILELRSHYPQLAIEVDIGVHAGNIHTLVEAGASLLAVNSAIFNTTDPARAFEDLQAIAWR